MRKETKIAISILILIALAQFFPLYYGPEISVFLRFSSPLSAEFAYTFTDTLTAFIAVLLFRKYCPDIWNQANTRLKAMRNAPFIRFMGMRKSVITSAICILFLGISGLVMTTHIKVFGTIPVQFERTERFVNPETIVSKDSMLVATGKKFISRLCEATAEELLFRWFLLRVFLGMLSSEWLAILLSSSLFGLMHVIGRLHEPTFTDQFVLVIPAVIAGVGLAIQYLKLGLFYSSLFHGLANSISAFEQETLGTVVLVIFLILLVVLTPIILIERGIKTIFRKA